MSKATQLQKLRILIADDHEVIRRALRSLLLSRPEWTICGEAADGTEAVRMARDERPDIVLMDISMPGMNGVQATKLIRSELPETPVLIISQNDPDVTRTQAHAAGASGYIAKADLSRSLLGAIDALTDGIQPAAGAVDTAEEPGSSSVPDRLPWLAGGGEMGALMRTRDWTGSPLGPPEQWSESLQLSGSICVSSRFDLIVWWGPELIMLYNDSYRRTLGKKHPLSLGRPGREVYPEVWDVVGPMLEHVLRTGEATFSRDLMLLLERNGYPEETYHTFSYTPIRDRSGKVVGVITPVAETTEQVISGRRLLTLRDLAARGVDAKNETDSWEFAAQALGANPYDFACAVLYKVDAQATTATATARTGVRADDSFFLNEVELAGNSPSLLSVAFREAIRTGLPFECNEANGLRLSFRGGFWRVSPSELIVLPISQTGQGKAIGALVVGVNPHKRLDDDYRGFLTLVAGQIAKSIADTRLLESERQRAEALAELDRAKTTFFSNISHELRTPLTLILGPVEDLLARGDPITASAEELHLVHRNVLRLLKLVNTLLDFSRIEAGRAHTDFEPTPLGSVTSEIASVFRSAVEKAGLEYEVDCPDLDERVYVDQQMWEKIVLNLISNALKFTSSGKIAVRLARNRDTATLSVADTGIGIPKDQLPKIFERFHRVEGFARRTHEGTGIGLALVQELVKIHGGAITVESELGVGTAFMVSLPFGAHHLPEDRIRQVGTQAARTRNRSMFESEALAWVPSVASPPQPLNARLAFGHTPQVLLVEDNTDMREYLRRLLQEYGYQVHCAPDGEVALGLMSRNSYDLILSDAMMPKMDGRQLLQAVRKDPRFKATPFVILSARTGEEFRIQGLGAGADDYLTKPFSARELLSRVSAHIDASSRRRESEERLSLALEVGMIGTWDIDLVSNAMFWSPGEFELYGYQPGECTPSWELWKSRIHNEDLPLVVEQWESAKKNHRDLRMECRVRLPNGQTRWIEGKARFFYDSGGNAYRAIGASRDVTERKQTEERLRSGRQRLLKAVQGHQYALQQSAQEVATQAELLDLANDAAFISDHDNRITYWNRGAERLYGWKKEEAIGHNASELLQTEFPVSYQDVLSSLKQKGVWEGELKHITRYGHSITVASRWTYRRDALGVPVGWLEINSDLTLQKQAQEAARRLSGRILQVQDLERRKLARELHDSLGQYLASLKVNIRSSLRSVQEDRPRKLLTECVEILEQCLTETRTISYLLHPPLLDETGLNSAIRWFVEGFSQRSGIKVYLTLPDAIPRFSDEIETTVFRILQESLTNAHRHSKTDRAQIAVEVTPYTIALTVRDYGCGIPSERLRSFLERNEGVGVGLGGMRERARELGGTLCVTAGEGNVGTAVSVEIPASPREAEEPPSGQTLAANSS
jgi:PAS domain S-box-containing protein